MATKSSVFRKLGFWWGQLTRALSQAQLLSSCATFSKLLNTSVPPFPPRKALWG